MTWNSLKSMKKTTHLFKYTETLGFLGFQFHPQNSLISDNCLKNPSPENALQDTIFLKIIPVNLRSQYRGARNFYQVSLVVDVTENFSYTPIRDG